MVLVLVIEIWLVHKKIKIERDQIKTVKERKKERKKERGIVQ